MAEFTPMMQKYLETKDLFAKNVVVILLNTKTQFLIKQRKIFPYGNLTLKKCLTENL